MARARRLRWLVATGLFLSALTLAYRPLFSGQVLAGRDLFRLFIPDAAFLLECIREGELPLWLPYTRLGQPFAATIQAQAFYPPRILSVLMAGPVWGITLEHLMHVLIAFCGAWLAARRMGARWLGALVAGGVFAFGGAFTQLASQQNVLCSYAWTGFMAAAAVSVGRMPGLRSAAWFALATALSFLAGSPETVLWQGAMSLALAWGYRPRSRPTRGVTQLGAVVVASLWGLAIAAIVVFPAAEYARESRALGPTDVLAWSARLSDLASLVFVGANWPVDASPEGQGFVLTLAVGCLAMLLAGLALSRRTLRRKLLPVILVAAGFAVLSLGHRFLPSEVVLGFFPFKLFRYPAKYTLLLAFLVPVLGGRGLGLLQVRVARGKLGLRGPIQWVLATFAGGAVAGVLAAILGARSAIPGIAFATLFASAGALVTRLPHRVAVTVVAALIGIELAVIHFVCGPPLTADAERLSAPSQLAAAIRDQGGGRLSAEAVAEPDASSVVPFIESSRDALVLKRNVEERLTSFEGYEAPAPRRHVEAMNRPTRALYDLAGVTWFLAGTRRFSDLEETGPAQDGRPGLYRSRTALPRAFVVHEVRAVSEQQALEALRDPETEFGSVAFVEVPDGGVELSTESCEGSTATIVEQRLSRMTLEVEACGAGLLVVTDSWAPGWRARIDGADVPMLRTDYLFRGVPVTGGRQRVEVRYLPGSFVAGLVVSLGALASAVGVLVRAKSR